MPFRRRRKLVGGLATPLGEGSDEKDGAKNQQPEGAFRGQDDAQNQNRGNYQPGQQRNIETHGGMLLRRETGSSTQIRAGAFRSDGHTMTERVWTAAA